MHTCPLTAGNVGGPLVAVAVDDASGWRVGCCCRKPEAGEGSAEGAAALVVAGWLAGVVWSSHRCECLSGGASVLVFGSLLVKSVDRKETEIKTLCNKQLFRNS